MTASEPAYLQRLAAECVDLVFRQYGRQLDWSAQSLATLDVVCAELLLTDPWATGAESYGGALSVPIPEK